MDIDFDPIKSERNEALRGLSFTMVTGFDFASALIGPDRRFDYGEDRWIAVGYVGERLHVVIFTRIAGGVRVISFRKANARERKRYAQAKP